MNDDVKKLADEVKNEVQKQADTIKTEVAAAVIEEINKEKAEVKAEVKAWYEKLPLWGKVAVLVVIVGSYFGYQHYYGAAATAPVNINVNVPPAPSPTPIQAVSIDKATADKMDTAKLFARILRHQTIKQLQQDGLKVAGGDSKPLSKEEATKLVANLEDEHLVAVAQLQMGDVAEGKFLDTITNLLQWLIAHKDTIKKIIELIITLLAVFM